MLQKNNYFHHILALSATAVLITVVLSFTNHLPDFLTAFLQNSPSEFQYDPPAGLIENVATSSMEVGTAVAVPILMYHGVVTGKDESGDNTAWVNFIEQMEMLKKNGYQTITVNDYDNFRSGKFLLPPKPIIITFDDGRKDSFYPVDEVLKKLGFQATIFIATVKANEHDPFYLSWEELKTVKETGRWEIEAHGRHSHDTVIIDAEKTQGRYLTSRTFNTETKIESVADFENRVRADYKNGILDLQEQLHIDARYFAIPLNDYGREESNYDGAYEFNKQLTKEYFKLAFIECLTDKNKALDTFYNYVDTDPYSLVRLEVKDMSGEDLKSNLLQFSPSLPKVVFPLAATDNIQPMQSRLYKEFGNYQVTNTEIILQTNSTETATKVIGGDKGWSNYSIDVKVQNKTNSEGWVFIYYTDEDNLIQLFWNESKVGVRQRFNGEETLISEKKVPLDTKAANIKLSVQNGILNGTINGYQLVKNYQVKLKRGAYGFGMWDPDGGELTIEALSINSLE